MIFSSIHAKDNVTMYPQAIQTALAYLKATDFTTLPTGVYEIEGKEIYAQVMDTMTGPVAEKRPEVHKKYVDVQFIVSGEECMGFTPDTGAYEVAEAIEERDLYFYRAVENEGFLTATPGCYCVFFPQDVHRPSCAKGEPMAVRKVVVKVAVSRIPPCV